MEKDDLTTLVSFGAWIRNRRQTMNLTRAELAEKVSCAPVTIKKIENDERKPSPQMAELLAKHLLIPGLEREAFLRMARGIYEGPAELGETSLRIPHSLRQADPRLSQRTVDFVERQKELYRLNSFLDQALTGNAVPVFLMGEAGSGKTTLMQEFSRLAYEAHPELLIAVGQCNAQTGPGDPYRPFRDLLEILTGDLEIDWTVGMLNREQVLRIWEAIPHVIQAISTAGPHLLDVLVPVAPLVHRLAPYLAAHTDWFDQFQAAASLEPLRHPDLDQGQVLEELTQVVRGIANRHPLLLIIEDLQWADDASLNALFHLSRRLTNSRVLLLSSYRTGENIARQAADHAAPGATHTPENLILELTRQYGDIQVRLDQTSPSEGRKFIQSLLDLEPNRFGEDFRENLFSHTLGHPLFAVEMLRSMRQNRNIVQDEAGYWVENKSSPSAPRPARVEALIEQRLRHLDPLQRELLNVASVEGERFTVEIVAAVVSLDLAAALKSFIHDLEQQHHLIQEQGQVHVQSLSLNRFQFHHMLIQEYLYSQLLPSERRRLHSKIADELERMLFKPEYGQAPDQGNTSITTAGDPGETLDTFGPALLHHFWTGENWMKAATYAHHLGKRARQRYAMREAIGYYEQALVALEHQDRTQNDLIFDVLLDWEEAAFKFSTYMDQLKYLSRAEEIARKMNDKPRLIHALHWTANVLLARGLWTQAGPALTESLSLAEELGNEELSVHPTYFKALMTTFADPAQALRWTKIAGDLSHKYDDLQFEALSFATSAQVLAQLGEFDRSLKSIQHARQLSERLGSPLTDSDVDLLAAWACLAMGDWNRALELGQMSVEKSIATDNMDCLCSGMVCIGFSNLEMGRIPEAASAFEKGIERSDISGAMVHKLNGQAGLAMTQFISGHPEAIGDLEKIAANMKAVEFHVGAANTNLMLGMCFSQIGDLEHATAHLNQAVDFYRKTGMYPSLQKASQILAELYGQAKPAN